MEAVKFLKLIHEVEDTDNGNVELPSEELADRLLGSLDIKPKISKAIPLPAEETIKIKEVDGEEIRDKNDQDFTQGGNGAAYPNFVDKDTLIYEKGHTLEGNLATIGHEFIERLIMLYLGWDYESAHTLCANPVEAVIRWACRKTTPAKEEKLFKKPASPPVEKWIKIYDEKLRSIK